MTPSRSSWRERLSRSDSESSSCTKLASARSGRILALVLLGLAVYAKPGDAVQGCPVEWISKSASGQPAWGDSGTSALSSDGRFVAFVSEAANLASGNNNGYLTDIFVVDRNLQTIEQVSVSTTGVGGNDTSMEPDISGDGRFVVFVSESTNLDPLDTHPAPDIYLHDRQMQTTQLVSIHIKPPAPFFPGLGSAEPKISPDGRFVVFTHWEDNIVPGDSNGVRDVFLRDTTTGVTELVSLASNQVQGDLDSSHAEVSADGRYVAFLSEAKNWYRVMHPFSSVHRNYVYVRDRALGKLIPVNLNAAGTLGPGWAGASLAMSEDGRTLVYPWGVQGMPKWIGALVAHDLLTGSVDLIAHSIFGTKSSQTYAAAKRPSISADGRFVVYDDPGKELVLNSQNKGCPNVYIHDRMTGLTQVAGLGPNGQWPSLPPQTCAEAFYPSISADGRVISFACEDPTFGSGNAYYNIYVRTCDWTQPAVYCAAQRNSLGCKPGISGTGSPSASAGSGFTVGVQNLISSSYGFFFYSTRKPLIAPFQGGYLCMPQPIRRMPLQATGGSTAPDCSGSFALDFNAWIATGADPMLVAGENACVQAWSRDPGSATGSNLSDAIVFAIGP